MKKIKVILFNAKKNEFTEHFIAPNLQSIYNILGVQIIELVNLNGLPENNFAYVDEEGALKPNYMTEFVGNRVLCGNVLFLSHDEDGDDISTDCTIQQLRTFVGRQEYDENPYNYLYK